MIYIKGYAVSIIKELHGVTLTKKGNTFQVKYGRNNVSTNNAITALNKFNSYVLIVLDEYSKLDLYYEYQNEGVAKNVRDSESR